MRTVPATNFLECSELCSKDNVRESNLLFESSNNNNDNINNETNDKFFNSFVNSPKNAHNSINKISKKKLIENNIRETKIVVKLNFNNINNDSFLEQLIGLNAVNSSDCETLRFIDMQIQRDLQDCVAVEYVDGQCHIIGSAENKYNSIQSLNGSQNARLISKSCVKVHFNFI